MHQWRFALSGLLVFYIITTVISNSCNSFNNSVVKAFDTSERMFIKTINGCVESKSFEGLEIDRLVIIDQNICVLEKDSVRDLLHLVMLDFSGNKIDSVLPGAFRNLPALKLFYLTNSNIKEIPRRVFDALPAMENLTIRHNEIDFIESQAFANLVSLIEIDASENRLDYWNREWFFNTTNLEVMDFSQNRIRTIPRGAFINLIKLKSIFLGFNEISVIYPNAFKGITQLNNLELSHNRLTQINDDIFPNDIRISTFEIGANYLNFLSSRILQKVTVDEVKVDYNPWKCPCLDRIKFWLYSTNGTILDDISCKGKLVPVCSFALSFSRSCFEVVDRKLTQRYINYLRGINSQPLEWCARLD